MRRLSGPWPRSVAATAPVVAAAAAIVAAAGALPVAIGIYGALFPWLLLLPVSTSLQLAAARGIHLVVWTTTFFPAPRWFFSAATALLAAVFVKLGRLDLDGSSFAGTGAPPPRARAANSDETAAFL